VLLKDLIAAVGRAVGDQPAIEHLPSQLGDVPITCADIERAGAALGYAPTVPLDEGLARFVEWYRSAQR